MYTYFLNCLFLEEKRTGVKSQRPPSEVVFSETVDPFSHSKSNSSPLSGEDVFVNCVLDKTFSQSPFSDDTFSQSDFSSTSTGHSDAWTTCDKENLQNLTHGFDDSFVDLNTREVNCDNKISGIDDAFGDIDPVFRTVAGK